MRQLKRFCKEKRLRKKFPSSLRETNANCTKFFRNISLILLNSNNILHSFPPHKIIFGTIWNRKSSVKHNAVTLISHSRFFRLFRLHSCLLWEKIQGWEREKSITIQNFDNFFELKFWKFSFSFWKIINLKMISITLISNVWPHSFTLNPTRSLSKWTFIRQRPSNNLYSFFSHKNNTTRWTISPTIRILICRFI